ncbi:MAG: UDP-2,3-diacylglucosamine diphosphatase [Terriglobales bacterium]
MGFTVNSNGNDQVRIADKPLAKAFTELAIPHYDTVIISDLHLGSKMSRPEPALQMLKNTSFDRLILLGDIFSDLNFRRLKKEHWQFLGYIRKLSNPKRGVEVVWVEGNHDHGLSVLMSHLVGIKVYQEYEWEYCGIRHLAVHGHRYDRFVINNRLVSNLLTAVHLGLQKFSFGEQRLVRFIDRFDSQWLRLSSKVMDGALKHARTRNAQRVFCGHTHEAVHSGRDGIEYFNSGSWTQPVATYITIDEKGAAIREHQAEICRPDSVELVEDFSFDEILETEDVAH